MLRGAGAFCKRLNKEIPCYGGFCQASEVREPFWGPLCAVLGAFCCFGGVFVLFLLFSSVTNVQKRLTGFAVLKLIFYKAFLRADGERSEPASEASLARQANKASPSLGQVVS